MKTKTDINSNLPIHISIIYVIFNKFGIFGFVIPIESPVFAHAEIDSKREYKKG